MPALRSIPEAVAALERLRVHPLRSTGHWDVPRVLHHVAQSIEYSMTGFPVLRPRWFRTTVGPLALGLFARRGMMQHDLARAVPGRRTSGRASAWPARSNVPWPP